MQNTILTQKQKIKFLRLKIMCLHVTYKKKYAKIFLCILKSLKKGVGSISQMYGSAGPDKHQNVTDPQHYQSGANQGIKVITRISAKRYCGIFLQLPPPSPQKKDENILKNKCLYFCGALTRTPRSWQNKQSSYRFGTVEYFCLPNYFLI